MHQFDADFRTVKMHQFDADFRMVKMHQFDADFRKIKMHQFGQICKPIYAVKSVAKLQQKLLFKSTIIIITYLLVE